MTNHDSDIARAAAEVSPFTVLLVDDQRFVAMAMERLLAGETDIRLQCCLSATEAVARANEVRPSVILQDLMMPDVDGLTLVGLYRRNPLTASTPVIVLSASDDQPTRDRARAAGATDYLVKLPERNILLDCIRRHAKSCASASAAAPSRGTASSEDAAFDRSVIAALRASAGPDGSALVATLLDQFIKEATALVARLTRAASDPSGAAEMKAAAHSLKGAALTMGARRLGTLAGKLEESADRGSHGSIDGSLVMALGDELARVREACTLERESNRP